MATNEQVIAWLTANPTASDAEITAAANAAGVSAAQLAAVTGLPVAAVESRMVAAAPAAQASAPVTSAPAATAAPAGLLDWKSQIFSSLNTDKAGAPKQLEFTPVKTEMLGLGDGEYQSTTGGELKTAGVQPVRGYGGDSGDGPILGYESTTPTTVNGLSVYAHYDPTGKLDYYAAPEATWLDDKTTARGMWDAKGNPIVNVQASGGGGFSEITSGFDDIVLQNPAIRAAILSYALGPTTGAEAGSATGAEVAAPTATSGSTMLDYSMPTAQGGLGLQGSAALDGTLSSGLAAPAGGSLGGGLGLTAGTAGNLAAMGGAQGLLANAAGGGTLNASGVNTGLFTPENLYKGTTSITNPVKDWTGTATKITASDVIKTLPLVSTIASLVGGGGGVGGGGSTGSTGFNIVPMPDSWKPPTYSQATQTPIDLNSIFTNQNLLTGTQWEGLPSQKNLTFNDIFAAGQQSTPMGTPVNINNLVSAILGQTATSQKSA